MRKKVGIVKRMSCLLLIFLLSINSFAAIVSDNDGSAFITKAEFDALKSSFQSQIDSYNNSIDSKIDGAIASYLAGIKLATIEDVQMPTSQRIYKTLDSVNFPQTWDNVWIDLVHLQLLVNGWRSPNQWPWMLKLNYSQNDKTNKGKNFVATCIGDIADDAYGILKGYTNNFVDYLNLLVIRGGNQQYSSSRDYYQRWLNIEIFHNELWAHDFWTGSGTHDTILGKHYDKCSAGFNLYGSVETSAFSTKTEIRIDSAFNQEVYPTTNFTSNNNRSTETVTYTLQSDKLVMVLGNNYKCPVQYDNIWSTGKSANNYKKYDVDYVKQGDKNQQWSGWLSESKSWADTTSPAAPTSSIYTTWTLNDARAYWPGFWEEPKLRTVGYFRDDPGNVNFQFWTEDAHAYFSSSDDYTTYDDRALTEEYDNNSWVDDIYSKWGTDAIYEASGKKYYKLGKGLILCRVDKAGKLRLGVTAKTDDVYFYVYNKPSSRSEAGLTALAGSDTSKGNGVLLTKDTHKNIEYNVDPGIYFFRFGTYTGDWTDLAGGAKIEFDDEFSLEIAN